MRLPAYLRHVALGCLIVAGCTDPAPIESRDSPVTATCVLMEPTPGTPTPVPTEETKEAFVAADTDGGFCCTVPGCTPMPEIIAISEEPEFCASGDTLESNATVLTAANIVASGKQVKVGGEQVDAIYGGCPLPSDPPGGNPTCGGGTLVLEVDATDTHVIAFATSGTPTVYAVPPGSRSVRVDQTDLKTLGYLIPKDGAWFNVKKPVTFNGVTRYLDMQTDWIPMATAKARTCRGSKC